MAGRRVQDKKNLQDQIAAEKEKIASLTRVLLTPDMVVEVAQTTALLNDKVMMLGEERLQCHITITAMSTQQFWKSITGSPAYRVIMTRAWRSFPRMHQMVFWKVDAKPIKNKTVAIKKIGWYLTKCQATTRLICEFMHGISGYEHCPKTR